MGRVAVPINFRLGPDEVEYIVDHSGCDVLILDPELEDTLGDIKVKHRFISGEESDSLFKVGAEARPWTPDENATATINYTSGTTARPKGVEMTHRNLWSNAAIFGWHTGVNDRDVYLHTLPQFHCNGWGMPYATTAMGVPQVNLRKVDGPEILRRIETYGVTLLCGAPAVVAAILDAAAEWDGEIPGKDGPDGRGRCSAAHPHDRAGRDRARVGVHPDLWPHRDGAAADDQPLASGVGRRHPGRTGVEVEPSGCAGGGDHHGHRSRGRGAGPGQPHPEVVLEQPGGVAEALADDWFHTGDGGVIDDAGYLTLQDRKKDVIISGGENVSSIEVEDCLFSHPAVEEVAVIGVPDEKWGETVKALVVVGGDADVSERDLIDYCREKIAHYKCPTSVEFRQELARTATGKLQKFKLRAPYWEGVEKGINGGRQGRGGGPGTT